MVFVLLLSMPIGCLLFLVSRSLHNEEHVRLRAEATRILRTVAQTSTALFREENARKVEDYSFFNVASNSLLSNQEALGFSALSDPASSKAFPEIVGYFQLGTDGELQTPLLPDISTTPRSQMEELIGVEELKRRLQVKRVLKNLTSDLNVKTLVASGDDFPVVVKTETPEPRRIEPEQAMENEASQMQGQAYASQTVRLPLQQLSNYVNDDSREPPTLRMPARPPVKSLNLGMNSVAVFDTRVGFLEYRHLVSQMSGFIRKVATGEKFFLQGFAIKDEDLVQVLFRKPFFSQSGKRLALKISFPGERSNVLLSPEGSTSDEFSKVILQTTLGAPLEGFTVTFLANGGTLGNSGRMVIFLGLTLVLVLTVGIWAVYALGAAQIRLARDRGNFVSAVSHELKTPLTSIRMYAEMLDGDLVPSNEKRKEYYRYISHESERLSRLVNNVLLFASLDGRKRDLELKPFRPIDLLRTAEEKMKAQVEEAGFSLQCVVPDADLPEVLCDGDAFLHIMINLIDNAVKFSSEAEERRIVLKVEKEGETVVFSVRDFGPGIPNPELRKIFTLFYRVENELTRKTKGTGLGLGLVSALAKQMSAQVSVRRENPGLEFQIRFTMAREAGEK